MQDPAACLAIHRAMAEGGYLQRLRAGGPALARVLRWAESFAGPAGPPADPLLAPHYPLFPGLETLPFRDTRGHDGVARLEAAFADIRAEALALDDAPQLDYTIAAAPVRRWRKPSTWLARRAPPRAWTVYPFFHMGECLSAPATACPRTLAVLRSLPDTCLDYPWGDALFSVQGPDSRLPPHCSIDNLRVRAHLGLVIPPGAGIRVGRESREWTEGRCLLFDDALQHEVWNPAPTRRGVLIVDFWNPGLSDAERRAIVAGFRHPTVRCQFMGQRLAAAGAPADVKTQLDATLQAPDPAWKDFWDC